MELLPAKRNKTVTKILSLGEEVDVENEQLTLISGYKVIHSSILQQMLQSVSKCKHCNRENTAQVFQENSKKKGLCEKFVTKCKRCTRLLGNYSTSPNVVGRKMFDVNLRSVMATTAAGGGLTMLKNICTNMDIRHYQVSRK